MNALALALLLAQPQWTPELDAYIEKARNDWRVPGVAITLVQDGKVLTKAYGVRRVGSPEPVDAHTMFDTASLSKSFTAAVVATLVDEGKMRWDDPVRQHLPAFELGDAYRSQHTTIRDLLAHRVGVESGNHLFTFADYPTPELLRRMRHLDEVQPFRGGFVYWNLGYMAAAEAAASAAGVPFAELVRTRLLVPLGMRESTVGVHHDVGAPNHADGHTLIDGTVQPIRAKKALQILGANAVNSTAHDMARWLLFQLGDGTWEGKRIVSAAAMREMHEPQMIIATTPEMRAARGVEHFAAYGLGVQVMDFRGRKMLWHSGNANGMPTYMAMLPEEKIGVCVMLNSWTAPTLHGALASRILDTLLEVKEPRDWAGKPPADETKEPMRIAGTSPSRPIEAYAGTYVDELYGDMTVTHRDGKLSLRFGQGEIADLEHWHHDVFRVRWRDRTYNYADTMVSFALDAEAVPRRLHMRMWRADIDATRR